MSLLLNQVLKLLQFYYKYRYIFADYPPNGLEVYALIIVNYPIPETIHLFPWYIRVR